VKQKISFLKKSAHFYGEFEDWASKISHTFGIIFVKVFGLFIIYDRVELFVILEVVPLVSLYFV
jgi:hypothetical protein